MNKQLASLLGAANPTSVMEVGATYQLGMKFITETAGDIFYGKILMAISEENYSIRDISDTIKGALTDARAVMIAGDTQITVNGNYGQHPVLIWINSSITRRQRSITKDVNDLNIEIMGHPDAVEGLKKFISETFEKEKLAQIRWWYMSGHGAQTREIYLPKNTTKILPEFYPDISDPSKYIADYMNAEDSVLLIAGPAGTGKTTLLRHMIVDYKLSAHVIYDESIMQKDSVFQSFLFDESGDMMIIEDADTILMDREKDNNKLMSRFLNVSDGLIKLPNKKLVFTTNISDFGKVDQALLRPGRCFGVMHTRALLLQEAQAAAKAANLPIPIEKREYTIAELFNQGHGGKQRSIGFGTRHG